MAETTGFTPRFEAYFQREVARKAAKSIANGAEIELKIVSSDNTTQTLETFTFTKAEGHNQVLPGPAKIPQLVFEMTPEAAEMVLSDPSEDVGTIGVHILKLCVAHAPAPRISVRFKAGFLTLFSHGYFGVMTAGGAAFASHLASMGLSGLGAIKAALKRLTKG